METIKKYPYYAGRKLPGLIRDNVFVDEHFKNSFILDTTFTSSTRGFLLFDEKGHGKFTITPMVPEIRFSEVKGTFIQHAGKEFARVEHVGSQLRTEEGFVFYTYSYTNKKIYGDLSFDSRGYGCFTTKT